MNNHSKNIYLNNSRFLAILHSTRGKNCITNPNKIISEETEHKNTFLKVFESFMEWDSDIT